MTDINIPTPAEAKSLLETLHDVCFQRVEVLRELSEAYQISGRPIDMPSPVTFQVALINGVSAVWKLAGGRVPVAFTHWSISDKIAFLEHFETIRHCYMEDIAAAYTVLRKNPLWVKTP